MENSGKENGSTPAAGVGGTATPNTSPCATPRRNVRSFCGIAFNYLKKCRDQICADARASIFIGVFSKPAHGAYTLIFAASLIVSFSVVPEIFFKVRTCSSPLDFALSIVVITFLGTSLTHSLFLYSSLTTLDSKDSDQWIGKWYELLFRWIGILALLYGAEKVTFVGKVSSLGFINANLVLFFVGVVWSIGDATSNRTKLDWLHLGSDLLAVLFWFSLLGLVLLDHAKHPHWIGFITAAVILSAFTYFVWVVVRRNAQKPHRVIFLLLAMIAVGFAAHSNVPGFNKLVPRSINSKCPADPSATQTVPSENQSLPAAKEHSK